MLVKLEETQFSDSWDGDGMRSGDNIRSHEWTGQLVTIELSNDDDDFVKQAVGEYSRCQSIETTISNVTHDIVIRATHLRWCVEWQAFYKKIIDDYWYVGTDYAPDDRPEVYDKIGNFLTVVPTTIKPGDFEALSIVVEEALGEM